MPAQPRTPQGQGRAKPSLTGIARNNAELGAMWPLFGPEAASLLLGGGHWGWVDLICRVMPGPLGLIDYMIGLHETTDVPVFCCCESCVCPCGGTERQSSVWTMYPLLLSSTQPGAAGQGPVGTGRAVWLSMGLGGEQGWSLPLTSAVCAVGHSCLWGKGLSGGVGRERAHCPAAGTEDTPRTHPGARLAGTVAGVRL